MNPRTKQAWKILGRVMAVAMIAAVMPSIGGCPTPDPIVGPEGPVGPQGPAGADGEQGPAGPSSPVLAIANGAVTVSGGTTVEMNADDTILQGDTETTFEDLTFAWAQVDDSGLMVDVTVDPNNPAGASFVAPEDEGEFLLQFAVTVTDPDGFVSIANFYVLVSNAVVTIGDVTFTADTAGLLGLADAEATGTFALTVTVSDSEGNAITDLDASAFGFRNSSIGGFNAPITVDSAEFTAPQVGDDVTAVLVFSSGLGALIYDGDGSARTAGGTAFLQGAIDSDADRVAIIDYGPTEAEGEETLSESSRLIFPFSSHRNLLVNSLGKLGTSLLTPSTPYGAALDAVDLLAEELGAGNGGMIVLMVANAPSAADQEQLAALTEAVAAQNALVYTVAIATNETVTADLVALAEGTGGQNFGVSALLMLLLGDSSLQTTYQNILQAAQGGFYTVEASATISSPLATDASLVGDFDVTAGNDTFTQEFEFMIDLP